MSTNIIQQMKAFEAERERMFAIYCADTGAGDMHHPFDNYRAGYRAATSRQEAKIKALVEALEELDEEWRELNTAEFSMQGEETNAFYSLPSTITALAAAKETS